MSVGTRRAGERLDRRRPPTIIDVASQANVAVGTVSRYLNGISIRPSKQQAIETAISSLGYRRNALAAAMKRESTGIIGLMLPRLYSFHTALLEVLAVEIRRSGHALLTYCHGGDEKVVQDALDFFASQRVDALVVSGAKLIWRQLEDMVADGIPVILYDRDLPGLAADRIFVDNFRASQRAVNHLIDLGHRQIAILVGPLTDSTGLERYRGYERAMQEQRIAIDPRLIVTSDWTPEGGYAAMQRLMSLDTPPTAIFTASSGIAIGALNWIKECDLSIPGDLSMISFDDDPLLKLFGPGITAIAQPVQQMAEAITECLRDRLKIRTPEAPRELMLECSIILRNSTRRID